MAVACRQSDDAVLVQRAQNGATRAFDELVRRYQDRVYRLSSEILRQEDAAAEALQDTFLSAYRELQDFKVESPFSTWLYRIAMNASLMRYRRRRDGHVSLDRSRSQNDEAEPLRPPEWLAQPPDRLLTAATREVMAEGLRRLHEDLRSVFVLRDIEGLSTAEVSSILKLSVSAVKARLHRGRLFLRDWMTRHFDDQAARRRPLNRTSAFTPEPAQPQMRASADSARADSGRTSPAGRDRLPNLAEHEERMSEDRGRG